MTQLRFVSEAGEFFSTFSNHRCDEYGGTIDNRARFILEVVRECRKSISPDFPGKSCRGNRCVFPFSFKSPPSLY